MKDTLILVAAFYVLLVIPATLHALLYKRHSRAALGWISFIIFAPYLGVALYVLFGFNRVKTRSRKLSEGADDLRRYVDEFRPEGDLQAEASLNYARSFFSEAQLSILRSGKALTNVPLSPNNRVRPLHNGEEAFPAMLEAIRSATSHVWLTTYIFETNPTGRSFIEALANAQRRGVDVRVILDGVGELYFWPLAGPELRKAGVTFARFLPPKLIPPQIFANLRNHRKLLVVDSRIAFTGGMNIGGRHMAFDPNNPTPVQDLHFSLEGPIVRDFETMFLHDWVFSQRHDGNRDAQLPTGTLRERLQSRRDLRRRKRRLVEQANYTTRTAIRLATSASAEKLEGLDGPPVMPPLLAAEEKRTPPPVEETTATPATLAPSQGEPSAASETPRAEEAQQTLATSTGIAPVQTTFRFFTEETVGDAWCRLIVDGPDHDLSKLETLVSSVLSSAQKRIVMFSPYFLPTESIESALVNAALRGVDVTVVIPEKTNQPLVHAAMFRMITWMLRRGVKVLMQPPPFAHTKLLIIDDAYVQMGSANMDPRSLRLNFELAVEVMDERLVETLMEYFQPVMDRSKPLTVEAVMERSILRRAFDGVAWLFSPYL